MENRIPLWWTNEKVEVERSPFSAQASSAARSPTSSRDAIALTRSGWSILTRRWPRAWPSTFSRLARLRGIARAWCRPAMSKRRQGPRSSCWLASRADGPYEDEEDKKDQGKAEYALLKQVAQLDSDAVLVCADASHRPLIERGVREMKIPRARMIGSAPGALASALRALVALEVGGSPSQVALTVLGTPPHHTVISWSDATARGQALTQLLEPPRLTRLKARVPYLWPPGPYTLASAASRVCEAIVVGGSTCAFSCFVGLDRELVSRVGNPLTFSGRGIPYGFVAPSSDIPEMIGRHAVPASAARRKTCHRIPTRDTRRLPRRISPVGRARSAGRHPYSDPVVERARARRARERAGRDITGGARGARRASGASELGHVAEGQAVGEVPEPFSKNESTAMET